MSASCERQNSQQFKLQISDYRPQIPRSESQIGTTNGIINPNRQSQMIDPLSSGRPLRILDPGAAVAAELHRQGVLKAALRARVVWYRLGFAPDASRRHFALDESLFAAAALDVARSSHELSGLAGVCLAQGGVVVG